MRPPAAAHRIQLGWFGLQRDVRGTNAMTDDPANPYHRPEPEPGDGGDPVTGPSGPATAGPDAPAPNPAAGGFAPPAAPGWQAPAPQGWAPPPPGPWGAAPGTPGTPGSPPGHGQPPGMQPAGWGWAPPPKPGVVPLRPLGIGDLLDGSFQAIRRNAGATLGLSVIVQLFVGVVTALVTLPLFTAMGNPAFLDDATPDFGALAGSLATLVGGSLLAGLLSVFLLVIVQGAVTIPVLRAVLNRKTRFGEALRILRPSIGRLLLLALIYLGAGVVALLLCGGIITVVALNASTGAAFTTAAIVVVLAAVISVWISVRVTFTAHVVVAENLTVRRALVRCFTLVKSSWWRCFGILLLTGIIVGVVTSLITSPLSMIGGMVGGFMSPEDPNALMDFLLKFSFITTILTALATGLGFAYQCAVTTLLYTDLRIRRDGFDMALLREFDAGVDAPIPGLAAATSPGHDAGTPGIR